VVGESDGPIGVEISRTMVVLYDGLVGEGLGGDDRVKLEKNST